jgi:hypothetical protein
MVRASYACLRRDRWHESVLGWAIPVIWILPVLYGLLLRSGTLLYFIGFLIAVPIVAAIEIVASRLDRSVLLTTFTLILVAAIVLSEYLYLSS